MAYKGIVNNIVQSLKPTFVKKTHWDKNMLTNKL